MRLRWLWKGCRHSGHNLRTHHAWWVLAWSVISSHGKLNDVDDYEGDVVFLRG
jgi:hypothetical protein